MEFLKKSIHMDQIGCEEQTQITLEDDVNIADAKPDVYQVVTQQGHVELEEVRASDGHVHVKGVLHFKVLYLADEETHHPACMEGELAFEEQILMGSVSGTDQVQAQAILEDLSVGMINSRKLSVQALLQIRLFTERMKQLDVAVGLDGTEQIEVKKKDLQALDFRAQDVLVGIAASGRTPYVLGAMDYARALGAPVIGLTCCPGSAIDAAADIGIAPQPGPEVVTGSTRLKSGTAQKMVLNMLSTAVMVKLGKVYSNLMVDVCASNQKLVARAVSIVCCATGVSPERARGVLDEAGFSAKTAIVMILCGVDAGEAHALVQRVDGQVSAAVLSRPDGVQTDAFVRRL